MRQFCCSTPNFWRVREVHEKPNTNFIDRPPMELSNFVFRGSMKGRTQDVFAQPFMELPSFVLEGCMKNRTQKKFARPPTFTAKS
jgi:hypothetical protein